MENFQVMLKNKLTEDRDVAKQFLQMIRNTPFICSAMKACFGEEKVFSFANDLEKYIKVLDDQISKM